MSANGSLLVIWDIDGTLVQTTSAIAAATSTVNDWLDQKALRSPTLKAWAELRKLALGDVRTLCELVAFEAGLPMSLYHEMVRLYQTSLLAALRARDGALEAMAWVKERGGMNAISSTGDAGLQRAKLKATGADLHVHSGMMLIYAAGARHSKPSGFPVKRLWQISGRPEALWLVGDKHDDIASARSGGAKSIYVPDWAQEGRSSKLAVLQPTHSTRNLADIPALIESI